MSAPATAQPLKLEVGKAYRTRDGRRVGIIEAVDTGSDDCWGLVAGEKEERCWHRDGRFFSKGVHKYDLIAEWDAPDAEAPNQEQKPGAVTTGDLKATPLAQVGVDPGSPSGDQVGVTFAGESARRAMACWNACQGVGTEELGAGLVKKLLRALEQIAAHPGPPESSPDEEATYKQVADDYCRRIAIARAALAQAKPAEEAPCPTS